MPDVDEHVQVAWRTAKRYNLSTFEYVLRLHERHEGFAANAWPMTCELGFRCSCQTPPVEMRVSIRAFRQALPEMREALRRLQRHSATQAEKLNPKRRSAEKKARALLYRYITREQKWSLRAKREFDVIGVDGRKYTISLKPDASVNTVYQGQKISFCIVSKDVFVPAHDAALFQKILLETDIERFLSTANAYNKDTQVGLQGATFMLDSKPWPTVAKDLPEIPLLDIPQQDLDNPEGWVRGRINV